LEDNKIPLLVVAGPTASGKTALAIQLAKKLDGEIVSADSMQIYWGMEIATAKPTLGELAAVPHHLIGTADPARRFSVAQYAPLAHAAIQGIHQRGHLPILCGGTGLYIQAVTENLCYAEVAVDENIREELRRRNSESLYDELKRVDPGSGLHPADRKRVVRALELYHATGMTISEQNERSRKQPSPYTSRMIFLNVRNRQYLYDRIDRRADHMLANGLLEEAAQWRKTATATAAQAIGYKELEPYFLGLCALDEAIARLKRETRRYAKRQLSWLRRAALEWNEREPGSCTELTIDNEQLTILEELRS